MRVLRFDTFAAMNHLGRPPRRTSLMFALLLAGTLFAGEALAKSLQEALDGVRARAMTNLATRVPGLSAAAGKDGAIVWSEGFGYADLAAKKPVMPQTMFRIGSISKPLTAVGLMLLVEQGRLDLDADIRQYVPDFPDKGAVITTRQLGGHLAGIRHYRGRENLSNKRFPTVRSGLKIFEDDPLLSRPGEKFSYSSYGYNLMSQVMEAGAKQEFLAYMERAVFQPLELRHTVPDRADHPPVERTKFYAVKSGGGFETAPAVDNSYKWAGGGFLSTPEDLVRFGLAMLRPGFLKPESIETMFTSQTTTAGQTTGYGLGWFVRRDRSGRRVFMHSGGSVGGTSVLLLYPDSGVVLAMTSNCSSSPFDKANLDAIDAEFSSLPSQP